MFVDTASGIGCQSASFAKSSLSKINFLEVLTHETAT